MKNFIKLLGGGDHRSISGVNKVVSQVETQEEFDRLFSCLNLEDDLIVERAIDAIEKISQRNPEFLSKHKRKILEMLKLDASKLIKWHLAQIVSRLELNETEFGIVWDKLTRWARNKKESRILRVHAIQSLFNLLNERKELKKDFEWTIKEVKEENIPSIQARLKILKL